MCKAERLNKGLDIANINNIPCKCGAMLKVKYSDRFDSYFYGCTRWPFCTHAIGMKPNGEPMGIPANNETREWRLKANNAFDRLYGKCDPTTSMRKKNVRRCICQKWLSVKLNIHNWASECKIERFDVEQCRRTIELCNNTTWERINKWHFDSQTTNVTSQKMEVIV